VSLGVAGDQLPIAGTSRAALEGAPCGSPIAAVTDELEPAPEPIRGSSSSDRRNDEKRVVAAVVAAVVASGSAGAAGVRWPHRGHRSHVVPTVQFGWDLPVPVGATVTDTVLCPAGSLATGGGADGLGDLRASGPAEVSAVPHGWTVTVRNDTDAPVSVKAYAVCVAS
jgi:hypothetical protein